MLINKLLEIKNFLIVILSDFKNKYQFAIKVPHLNNLMPPVLLDVYKTLKNVEYVDSLKKKIYENNKKGFSAIYFNIKHSLSNNSKIVIFNFITFLIVLLTYSWFLDLNSSRCDAYYTKNVVYILLLPLSCSILCGLFGFYIGWKGSMLLSTVSMWITFIHTINLFYFVNFKKSTVLLNLGEWISCDLVDVNWSFMFDSLSSTMLLVVVFLSLLIHLYACGYMYSDPHVSRFLSFLSLFTFAMIILVTADNLLVLFVGWEGVGICSYLLISFWFTRVQAVKSALKAIIVNKIADTGLLLAICVSCSLFKSVDFYVMFALTPYVHESFINQYTGCQYNFIEILCLCLTFGAMGKSAQIGLHTWLPDAMEGPTPVSALLHAATMVTAGVYLILRCSPIFEYAPITLTIITCVGATTAFMGASIGLVQTDIKKIIAYSTCSQLGYMMLSAGLSNYNVSLFHLVNHAFFKALLFLSAGSVIHALSDEQDIRKMGGLFRMLPITFACFSVGSLSLMGLPYMAGFYSKDLIINLAFCSYTVSGTYAYILGTFSAMLTAFYSFRLLYWVFISEVNGHRSIYSSLKEPSWMMLLPMVILSFFSIFSGYLFKDFFSSTSVAFADSLYINPQNFKQLDVEFIPVIFKILPTLLSFLGAFSAVIFSKYFNIQGTRLLKNNTYIRLIYETLCNGYYFDAVYNKFIAIKFMESCENCYLIFDKEIVENLMGPTMISTINNSFLYYKNESTVIEESSVKRPLCAIIMSVFVLIVCLTSAVCLFL